MPFSEIRYDVEDGVCTVTLNRPDRLNAVTSTTISELGEAWERADADDRVRAVIVTGAGRAFCAGADLGAGGSTFNYSRASAGGAPAPRRPAARNAYSRASAGGPQPRDGLQRAMRIVAPRSIATAAAP